jgi:4-hydroxybenzoate polyprenyltransferase/phosphoserine phosphatase
MAAQQGALCVDLDGTLLRSDLLHESLLALLASNPLYIFLLPFWLLGGKAVFKRRIAERVSLLPETLPYDARLLEALRTTGQRPRVLCTASDELLARPIAGHLGLFDEVIASDGRTNLAGRHKAEALVERFGEGGFDYAGNSKVDLQIWRHARGAIVVGGETLARAAAGLTTVRDHLPTYNGGNLRTWLRALRLHQWLKNLLVLVPVFTSHRFLDPVALTDAVIAFIAFGLCASGVYILNDLLDLTSDRQHPRKRLRPFAAGTLPLSHGLAAAPVLTMVSFALALWCSPVFAATLLCYYAMTLGYSLRLKRIVMIDVILLAALYTVRIIGGTVAIGSELSFWLLAFSMFIFLSLALLKRYTELALALAVGKRDASGRGYGTDDLPLIQSLGAASGYIGVLVFALYINSPESLALYGQPKLLWLMCPLLLYWISRMWVIAHRGVMHDDPVVFAATDRVSQAVVLICVAIVLAAI